MCLPWSRKIHFFYSTSFIALLAGPSPGRWKIKALHPYLHQEPLNLIRKNRMESARKLPAFALVIFTI